MNESQWEHYERLIAICGERFIADAELVEPSASHRLSGVQVHERKEVTG